MKRKVGLTILALLIFASLITLVGCKAYDVPEFVTIGTNQTAFLVPLIGDTSEQDVFASEELLAAAQVATKQVQIPHKWIQTGHSGNNGYWAPTMRLILVDRSPVTRQWSELDKSNPSAPGNTQTAAIGAESKEPIGFSALMNCSAQIETSDAVKYLFLYGDKPLSEVMDTEIRSRIETRFVEKCSTMGITEIFANKAEIIDFVRADVIPYFKGRGITITMLGLKDGLYFDNQNIQASFDEMITSANELEIQENNNAVKIKAVEAEAQAKQIAAEAEAKANETIEKSLTPALVEFYKWSKVWDGKLPIYIGGDGELVQIPMP